MPMCRPPRAVLPVLIGPLLLLPRHVIWRFEDFFSAPKAAGHKGCQEAQTLSSWLLFSQSPLGTTADNQKIPRLTTCTNTLKLSMNNSLVEPQRVDNTQAHHLS